MPTFITGRLAMLYRSLGQLDNEVELLERYKNTETSDATRHRFEARLAKARALAERSRTRDSVALASVRAISSSRSTRMREASRKELLNTVEPAELSDETSSANGGA